MHRREVQLEEIVLCPQGTQSIYLVCSNIYSEKIKEM